MRDDGTIRRWPWLVAAGIILLLLLSIRSTYQLKSTPTREFAAVQAQSETLDREQWVLAYWECARSTIQWKYNYGTKLPSDPPPEFTAAAEPLRRLESPEIRRRYWAQLRQDWLDRNNWEVSYGIDFSWIPALLNSSADHVRDSVLKGIRGLHQ